MYCPFCAHQDTKVLESRILENALRRRRECQKCNSRFTTYEKAAFRLAVVKKDGREEPFSVQKLVNSIQKACAKVDPETIRPLARRVEQKILRKKTNPIKAKDIGHYSLAELKKFNKIAYVRFA